MPTYRYDYRSDDGRPQSYWASASTLKEAVETLRGQGFEVSDEDIVAEDGPDVASGFLSEEEIEALLAPHAHPSAAEGLSLANEEMLVAPTAPDSSTAPATADRLAGTQAAELGRMVAEAIDSSLPLPVGLRALADTIPSRRMARRLRSAARQIERGTPLDEAARAAGLPPYVRTILSLGMQSGRLAGAMNRFCEIEQQGVDLRYRAWRAMLYPALVGLVVLMIAAGLLGFVVPQFSAIFEDFDTELPMLTEYIVLFSDLVRAPAFLAIAGLVVALGVLVAVLPKPAWLRTLLSFVPILGTSLRYNELSQIARRLALLSELETPLPEALRMTAEAMPRHFYTEHLRLIAGELQAGLPVRDAVKACPSLSRSLRPFLTWGEANAALSEAMRGAAESFEDRATHAVLLWEVVLPQIVFFCVVTFVGLMVIGLFMPLIKLITCLSG